MSLSLRSGAQEGEGPALLVHGGAWDIPDDALDAHRDGLCEALSRGREALRNGAEAVDVVTSVVATLEAYGAFDAGRGAMLNQDGEAELDAGVMDGASLAYGAVMATKRLAQPVAVARRLLNAEEGRVRMLAGAGAERFAEAQGFDLVDNETLICDRERRRYEQIRASVDPDHPSASFLPGAPDASVPPDSPGADTVGCVARDWNGTLAAATSTGGTPFKPPGRVGDSPVPGAGFYAASAGAAGATGWGEAIAAVVLSSRAVLSLDGSVHPETIARDRLAHMHEAVTNPDGEGATGGLLLMDAQGRAGWAYTTPRMARGGWQADGDLWVDV